MPQLEVKLTDAAVTAYVTERGLIAHGFAPISAALLQRRVFPRDQPAVVFVIEVDGKPVLARTSLQILETMLSAMRAASGVERDP